MDVFIGREFSRYYEKAPLTLVDIGARGGIEKNWRRARQNLCVIGFEPDTQECEKLALAAGRGARRYLNSALYKSKGTVEFHHTRAGGASSIFRPNRDFVDRFPESSRLDIVGTVAVEADTLDNQLRSHGIRDVDFVKVDTQGSELYVLQGGRDIICGSVFGMEIEVEFAPVYEGQPLFSDVDALVRGCGFSLFDLKPYYWKRGAGQSYGRPKGQIIFADALYLRDTDSLHRMLGPLQGDSSKKAKIARAISICAIYGYLDYALEIFTSEKDLFTREEQSSFMKALEKDVSLSRKIPDFRGRGHIANCIHSLYRLIHPSGRSWHSSGRALGNVE